MMFACSHWARQDLLKHMCLFLMTFKKEISRKVLTITNLESSNTIEEKSKLKASDETWFEGSFWMPPLTHTAGLSRGRRVESAALVTIHRDSRSFSPVWGSLEVFEGQCPVDLL